MNVEEISLLTVTLVEAWGRLNNMSEAIISGGKEDIAASGVVHLQSSGETTAVPHSVCIKLEVFLL